MRALILDPVDILFTIKDSTLRQSAVEQLGQKLKELRCQTLVLASIQGGVGLRFWKEEGGFGNPAENPAQEEIENLFDDIASNLSSQLSIEVLTFLSFAYQSKSSGAWGPTPDGDDPRWWREWRFPDTGMLHAICDELHAWPASDDLLFVSAFDYAQQAALEFGMPFKWAKDFFAEPQPQASPAPSGNSAAFWGVVEIMGHTTVAGRISQESFAGKGFIRVDVPDEAGFSTQYISPNSVYRFSPTDEGLARKVAERERTRPDWALGLKTIPLAPIPVHSHRPQLPSYSDYRYDGAQDPPPFAYDGPPPDYYDEPSEPIQFTPPHMHEEVA